MKVIDNNTVRFFIFYLIDAVIIISVLDKITALYKFEVNKFNFKAYDVFLQLNSVSCSNVFYIYTNNKIVKDFWFSKF